ncbi:pyridoxamine 5'-phosphate oxidase family protein [Cohnella suwonensis]|uniref:Pyridoxamine 5'-phosphate oxidase family protein n=1 Tax=Cohnella suwonensis TaxID=696072 RepID=A0ABW0LUG0_9BACL
MRRKEFEVTESELCESFLKEKNDGVLTFAGADGWPKAVPLNYVFHGGAIYFHGSKQGEKMAGLAANPRAEFVVYQAHAFIPSYFSDPYLACPATVFFRSVRARGNVEQVTDAAEKASALQALMTVMQPEGRHAPIDAADAKYSASLKGVAVLRLDPIDIAGKFKFGQNLSDKRRDQVVGGLSERGLPEDEDAIKRIRDSALKCPMRDN